MEPVFGSISLFPLWSALHPPPCTPLPLSIFMLYTSLFKHFRFFMSFTAHLNIIPCRIPRSTSSQHTLAFHPAPPSRFLFSCSTLPIEAFWIFHSACTPIRKNTYQKKNFLYQKNTAYFFGSRVCEVVASRQFRFHP